jgi:hypothetical protein
VVLPSKFCADIIFSLGNMKLFVSFSHITALLRNNCHIGDHFENKMAAIALKLVAQIYVFYDYSIVSSQNLIIKVSN